MRGIDVTEAIERTGVHTRYWLSEEEDPLVLGTQAAEQAIADAGLRPADIDLVLNASGTPMQAIPDGGALMGAALGLTGHFAFSLHATCISFLVALQQAAFLIDAERARHVVIVSTEAGSRGLNFDQPESALLIGDAAVAIVVGPADRKEQGLQNASFTTDPRGVHDAEIRGFGTRIPVTHAVHSPADFQFDMNGLKLLRSALTVFPTFLETIAPGFSNGAPGIDRIIPHQTSKAGMELMSRFWGWDRMTVTLADVGNTIAASIPLAMHRTPIQPGEKAFLIGTGSGTHYGALVVQW